MEASDAMFSDSSVVVSNELDDDAAGDQLKSLGPTTLWEGTVNFNFVMEYSSCDSDE